MIPVEEIMVLLCSTSKLERDKGLIELQKILTESTDRDIIQLQTEVLCRLQDTQCAWESKHGCLLGGKSLLSLMHSKEEFPGRLKEHAIRLLTDVEVRVRIAAGEVMGEMCSRYGYQIYLDTKEHMLHLVRNNLDRQTADDDGSKQEQEETDKLMERLAGPSTIRRSSVEATAQMFHDTAGWRSLESTLKCLQLMIEGCGRNFNNEVDEELLELIFETLGHPNRFVREMGFYVSASVFSCGSGDSDQCNIDDCSPIIVYGIKFSSLLAKGLADNWSQVRMAACVATKKMLINLPSTAREKHYPELLPRLCLNRYYSAEGVRNYSQETWRQVTGIEGVELVERYINETVQYYKLATKSDNHVVREAACACIAELGSKISALKLRPFVEPLLETLLLCFQDDSWAVRDAACLASGNFVLAFPMESHGTMESLYPMFFGNLGDTIGSVRMGAALSLANVVRAYGQEALDKVMEQILQGLQGIRSQPSDSERYPGLEPGLSTSGSIQGIRENDPDLHTGSQISSCVSLAPRMARGEVIGIGSSSSTSVFRKPPQPWEMGDGCVSLLAELAQIQETYVVNAVLRMLPLVAEASYHHHYEQHTSFLDTLCKQLPHLARGLGKKNFKGIVHEFFDAIFYSLDSENSLTSSSASQCLNQLGTLLGPNILRSKVESFKPQYLPQFDANVHIAPL